MTDGTSQGLFIVVAIVIFGIFVVLAYILFEDTLSPAMASMFNEAIEQASDNLNNNYTDEKYFVTEELENGTLKIIDYLNTLDFSDAPTDIRIPPTINGKKVTVLGEASFRFKNLTSVWMPDTITTIENGVYTALGNHYTGVFANNNINEFRLSRNVTHLGNGMFRHNKLTSVTIPNHVKTLGGSVFENNNIESLYLGSGLVVVSTYAFSVNKLKELHIPNNIKHLHTSSFGYNKLEKVVLHENLLSISDAAFVSNNLSSVEVYSSTALQGSPFDSTTNVILK